ncbi:MAG: DUF3105 domain-containing protein [Candidatus Dojkabacteria bacterium]
MVFIGSRLLGSVSDSVEIASKQQIGEYIENQGADHVTESPDPSIYNSLPPTSGPHTTSTAWGIYETEVLEGNQIHNLEHGGIFIQYKDSEDSELISRLTEIVEEARKDRNKIVLAPYSKMGNNIALTS